ncbi:MAG: hypothetical protein HUK24_07620, partial [Sphaerochaetaceae bacterium]|nr:hypothetical protein [Sphaerochaetaceae bacterium]
MDNETKGNLDTLESPKPKKFVVKRKPTLKKEPKITVKTEEKENPSLFDSSISNSEPVVEKTSKPKVAKKVVKNTAKSTLEPVSDTSESEEDKKQEEVVE